MLGHSVVIIFVFLLVCLISLAFPFCKGRCSSQTLFKLFMKCLSVYVGILRGSFLLFLRFDCWLGYCLLCRKLPVAFDGIGIARFSGCGHCCYFSTFKLGMDCNKRILIFSRGWWLTSLILFLPFIFFIGWTCLSLFFVFRLNLLSRKCTLTLLAATIALSLSTGTFLVCIAR